MAKGKQNQKNNKQNVNTSIKSSNKGTTKPQLPKLKNQKIKQQSKKSRQESQNTVQMVKVEEIKSQNSNVGQVQIKKQIKNQPLSQNKNINNQTNKNNNVIEIGERTNIKVQEIYENGQSLQKQNDLRTRLDEFSPEQIEQFQKQPKYLYFLNQNSNKEINDDKIDHTLNSKVLIIWLIVIENSIIPKEIKRIIEQTYVKQKQRNKINLQQFINQKKYKGYQEHKKKLQTKLKQTQPIIPLTHKPEFLKDLVTIHEKDKKCVFKIITDVQSFEQVVKNAAILRQKNRIINQVHVYYKNNKQYNKIVTKNQKINNIVKYQLIKQNNLIRLNPHKNGIKKINTIVKSFFTKEEGMINKIRMETPKNLEFKLNPSKKLISISIKIQAQDTRRFPDFIILDPSHDKSKVTLLRRIIDFCIKQQYSVLKEFKEDTIRRAKCLFGIQQTMEQNSKQKNIKKDINQQIKADIDAYKKQTYQKQQKYYKQILKLYTKQSFYYPLLNNSLRISQKFNDFKPCIVQVHQMYHAIKTIFQNNIQKVIQKNKQDIYVWRGCKMSNKNYSQLKINHYIQMHGYLSTSLKQENALKFMTRLNDQNQILLKIKIPKGSFENKDFKKFNGFVDFKGFDIQSKFQEQQQILFNVLNIFKITKIIESEDDQSPHIIQAQWIDIQELKLKVQKNNKQKVSKDKNKFQENKQIKQNQKLQNVEQQIKIQDIRLIQNLQYWNRISKGIKDLGDLFQYSNELQEAQSFYQNKINQLGSQSQDDLLKKSLSQDDLLEKARYLKKKSDICRKLGNIKKARQDLDQAVKIYQDKNLDHNKISDQQRRQLIFAIHIMQAKIQEQIHNYPKLDQKLTSIIKQLKQITPNNVIQRSKNMLELAKVKFKKGQIQSAQQLYEKTKRIYDIYYVKQEKKSIFQRIKKFLFQNQEDRNKQQQTLKNIKRHFQDNLIQFRQLNIQMNNSLKKVSQRSLLITEQHRKEYQNCIKLTQLDYYRKQIIAQKDPQKRSEFYALSARISQFQSHIKAQQQAQKLYEKAIKQLQENVSGDHIKLIQYSINLAQLQQKTLQTIRKVNYNKKNEQEYYKKCKKNLQRAKEIIQKQKIPQNKQEIAKINNKINSLDLQFGNYKQCSKRIQQNKNLYYVQNIKKSNFSNMTISQTQLTDAKLSFQIGYNKKAFQCIYLSENYIKFALKQRHIINETDKNKIDQYTKCLQNDPQYLQIIFLKSKVFHRQLKHDMSLQEINYLESIMKKDITNPLLPDVYQMKGQYLLYTDNINKFSNYFQKAIKLRIQLNGKQMYSLARNYYNYAKNLAICREKDQKIKKIIDQADQISGNHTQWPQKWIGKLVTAFVIQQKLLSDNKMTQQKKKSQIKSGLQAYQDAKKFIDKYFRDNQHSSRRQIRLGYANYKNTLSDQMDLKEYRQILDLISQVNINISNKSNNTDSTRESQNSQKSQNKEQKQIINQSQSPRTDAIINQQNNQNNKIIKQLQIPSSIKYQKVKGTDDSRITVLDIMIKQLNQLLKKHQQNKEKMNQNKHQPQISSHNIENQIEIQYKIKKQIEQLKELIKDTQKLKQTVEKENKFAFLPFPQYYKQPSAKKLQQDILIHQ